LEFVQAAPRREPIAPADTQHGNNAQTRSFLEGDTCPPLYVHARPGSSPRRQPRASRYCSPRSCALSGAGNHDLQCGRCLPVRRPGFHQPVLQGIRLRGLGPGHDEPGVEQPGQQRHHPNQRPGPDLPPLPGRVGDPVADVGFRRSSGTPQSRQRDGPSAGLLTTDRCVMRCPRTTPAEHGHRRIAGSMVRGLVRPTALMSALNGHFVVSSDSWPTQLGRGRPTPPSKKRSPMESRNMRRPGRTRRTVTTRERGNR
jgi:hypothetical protein